MNAIPAADSAGFYRTPPTDFMLTGAKQHVSEDKMGEEIDELASLFSAGRERPRVNDILFGAQSPWMQSSLERYSKNIELLSAYPHVAGFECTEFKDLNLRLFPHSQTTCKVFDREDDRFIPGVFGLDKGLGQYSLAVSDIPLIVNNYSAAVIGDILEKTTDPDWIHGQRTPVYLYYSNEQTFKSFLQIMDLHPLLHSERVVFLLGEAALADWLSRFYYSLPTVLIQDASQDSGVSTLIRHAQRQRQLSGETNFYEARRYYQSLGREGIIRRISSGACRVLIPTTRFSNAIQFYARDMASSLSDMGLEVNLCIEDNPIQSLSAEFMIEKLVRFKPDVVISIDHFRFESNIYPPELAFVTWIQDPLPWIMNADTPSKMGDMDVILNALFSSSDLRRYGYSKDREIIGPLPVNETRFIEMANNADSASKDTDVIAFSSSGDPFLGFEKFCDAFHVLLDSDSRLRPCLRNMFDEIYQDAIDGRPLFAQQDITNRLDKAIRSLNLSIAGNGLEVLAEQFQLLVNRRILRSVPLEWLSRSGFALKIYGEEWTGHPRLGTHAMGRANNADLPQIISKAKIVIGNNGACSTHPRVGEALLGGALYIGWDIPAGSDDGDIRQFLVEGKEILFFKDERSLVEQVNCYLHEEQRRAIVSAGAEKVRQKLTYKGVMGTLLEELPARLACRE